MAIRVLFFRGAWLLGCLFCLVFSSPAPAAAGGVYFVKAGDTLTGISRVFGVSVDRIIQANRLGAAVVRPGDRIRIPDVLAKTEPRVAVPRHRSESARPASQARPAKPEPLPGPPLRREASAEPVLPALVVKPESPDVVSQHPEVSSQRVQQVICRNETVYHSVEKGDTLYALANRYATELDNLLQLNGMKKSARLSIGQKVIVRKSGPRTHTVRQGETLSRIAARYGVEADSIARLNPVAGTTLMAGQQLAIEPCDPFAVAGSAPPPLGGRDGAVQEPGPVSSTTADSAATLTQRVIKLARTMLNVPYRFGGSTLRGIDCSAYVQRVFKLIDVQIPRTAREQYSVGARIDRGDIQVGDLIFFRTYASFPSHVGIYLGDNLFIHASSMVRRVTIDSLERPYYAKRFIGARRLVDDGRPAVAAVP